MKQSQQITIPMLSIESKKKNSSNEIGITDNVTFMINWLRICGPILSWKTNRTPASRSSGSVNHSYDHRLNWTPLSPITFTYSIIIFNFLADIISPACMVHQPKAVRRELSVRTSKFKDPKRNHIILKYPRKSMTTKSYSHNRKALGTRIVTLVSRTLAISSYIA